MNWYKTAQKFEIMSYNRGAPDRFKPYDQTIEENEKNLQQKIRLVRFVQKPNSRTRYEGDEWFKLKWLENTASNNTEWIVFPATKNRSYDIHRQKREVYNKSSWDIKILDTPENPIIEVS